MWLMIRHWSLESQPTSTQWVSTQTWTPGMATPPGKVIAVTHSGSDWHGTSHLPARHTASGFCVFETHSRFVVHPTKTHVEEAVSQ